MSSLREAVIWSWLLLCLSTMVLTGRHTVEGAGEDIQSAGRAIEKAAE
jgi:predicted small secreted protein